MTGRLAAVLFVPLWSSGILGGAMAIRHGPPFAVTGLRMALAALVLALLALAWRADWPRGAALGHAVVVGLLLQGAHYAGIYAGFALGMPVGVAGLVVGLIPVATALGAAPLLGEPFTRQRLAAAGLGLGAVLLVVGGTLAGGAGGAAPLALAAVALAGGAGAALWQKRFGGGGQGLGAAAVQLAAGTAVMGLCWALLEAGVARGIDWSPGFLAPFLWTVLANSVGATLLLLWLLGRGAAGQVTGLFFLVPPVTALGAALLLGEAPSPRLLAAILLGAAALWVLREPTGRRSRAAG
ncbi:EamA family transporter [Dankookia sp. GCM10030260]|uniref:EamA family transporter n=1 Tax=Dankookia sp. GCM10030260 TaxID=3273390 RepID=UPI003614C00A